MGTQRTNEIVGPVLGKGIDQCAVAEAGEVLAVNSVFLGVCDPKPKQIREGVLLAALKASANLGVFTSDPPVPGVVIEWMRVFESSR